MLEPLRLDSRRSRLTIFSLFYLAEGVPWGFTSVALAALFRRQGVGLEAIGAFTAALYAPWAMKWAWAPLVDLVRPRRFGPARTWIALCQTMMIASLAAMLLVDLEANVRLLTLLAIVHNVFAATSDVAIDGLAVRVVPRTELGTANGFMFGFQYAGIAVGGAGTLGVASVLGFQGAFVFALSVMVLLLFGVTLRLEEPAIARPRQLTSVTLAVQILDAIRGFFAELARGFFRSGRGPMVGVLFAVLPHGAMALGLSMLTTMQVDLGMQESSIATLSFFVNVLAGGGAILGGMISDRLGHRRCLALWYVLTAVPTLWLASRFTGAGMAGVTLVALSLAVLSYNFFFGFIYGTSNAIYMSLSNPVVGGTQFTGYMALSNVVYSYSSLWQNRMAASAGYASMLRLDGLLAFAPLLLIPFLVPARGDGAEPAVSAPREARDAA